MGLFRTNAPVRLPDGIKSIFGSRGLVVLLARYEAGGTLQYDELVFGVPARRGFRLGLFVDAMWVNDAAALWGGRRIWGVPKQMARFAWDEDSGTVRIEDASGRVVTLGVNAATAWFPSVPLPAPFFGRRDGEASWLRTRAWLHGARFGWSGLRVREWSPRFAYGVGEKPLLGLAAKFFRLTVPPPTG